MVRRRIGFWSENFQDLRIATRKTLAARELFKLHPVEHTADSLRTLVAAMRIAE